MASVSALIFSVWKIRREHENQCGRAGQEISIIRSNIIAEYNTLRGYSWKWFAGVAVAFVVLIFATSWFVKTELQDNYNASAAVYQKVADLEKLLTTEQKPERKKN